MPATQIAHQKKGEVACLAESCRSLRTCASSITGWVGIFSRGIFCLLRTRATSLTTAGRRSGLRPHPITALRWRFPASGSLPPTSWLWKARYCLRLDRLGIGSGNRLRPWPPAKWLRIVFDTNPDTPPV